jgi:hypothetical protein
MNFDKEESVKSRKKLNKSPKKGTVVRLTKGGNFKTGHFPHKFD